MVDVSSAILFWFALFAGAATMGCEVCGTPEGPPVEPPVIVVDSGRVEADSEEEPRQTAARLKKVSGDVRWQAANTANWQQAGENQDLRPADSVQTMIDGSTEIFFILSGSTAVLGPNTTLRVPEQPPQITRFKHLRGRLVARLAPQSGGRMEVVLPPGTLVLDHQEGSDDRDESSVAEAHVEIDEEVTAVTMIRGEGTLRRTRQSPVKILEQHFVEVDDVGEVVNQGSSPPLIELISPQDGASVTTRDRVRFEWRAVEGVDAYVVEVTKVSSEVVRRRVEAPTKQAFFELEAGDYHWTVLGESSGRLGVMDEHSELSVIVDRTPPNLSISSPRVGAMVRSATVSVSGATDPGATAEVNGQPVVVGDDGGFSKNLSVRRGISNIVIRVSDDLGNARAVSRTVVRE